MYEALFDALDDDTCLVTANRRLARDLRRGYGARLLDKGKTAWRTPEIHPWHSWLGTIVAAAASRENIQTRLNAHQSQLLWERCLRKELDEGATGLASLVRLAMEAWQRLADARVSIRDVARSAGNRDQRIFAAAAGRYLAVLEHERWIDDAGLGELALSLIRERQVRLAKRYLLVGFDRRSRLMVELCAAIRSEGASVDEYRPERSGANSTALEFEHRDEELRSAGRWARQKLAGDPAARIAVVAAGLEQSASRDGRLLRDGFVPGWQSGDQALGDAVNVSFGRRLSEYPAIAIALSVLKWLTGELRSGDVALLLLSPLVGADERAARSRIERRLRDLPDRSWSPSMITAALRGTDDGAPSWFARVAALAKRRRDLAAIATPAQWASTFDEVLREFGWPGPGEADSKEWQLLNRWRDLLNEFARLALVASALPPHAALARIEQMAAETVFQPESTDTALELLGPLEASGAEFDAIWITGLTSQQWPPPSWPSPLLSRSLQIENEMPDATAGDTLRFADTLLTRLFASAPEVVCSYSLTADDTEQTESELLRRRVTANKSPDADDEWFAASLVGRVEKRPAIDAVPAVREEKLSGGAILVQWQTTEPFAAFASGRLGVRPLRPQAVGVPAPLRGTAIHDALYKLYMDLPDKAELARWDSEERRQRIAAAVDFAFFRHEKQADDVLLQLLRLERRRTANLLRQFVELDASREDFRVSEVEGRHAFVCSPVELSLRFDRVDRYPDGTIGIVDYKTGATRQLLGARGDVRDLQLFVYAMTSESPVSSLALANVESRETVFSGAGRGFDDEADFTALLAEVADKIAGACADFAAGDVRVLAGQGESSAREFNLLTRYTELRHDPG